MRGVSMLDAFLVALKDLCVTLLPILGAAALIYLCILLKHLWQLIDTAKETVKNLDPTIAGVNQSLDKIQKPLDTVVRLSRSVDKVQDKTDELLGKAADFVASRTAGEEKSPAESEADNAGSTVIQQPGEDKEAQAHE